MRRLDRTTILDLLVLLAASLAVRGVARLLTGFDGLYGQDAYAYLDYTATLRAALLAFQAPPPFFWPIGYPLLVVVAGVPVGSGPLAAQLVSVVAGALVAPLVAMLVREVAPAARGGGLLAGALVACAPQLAISSLSVMADAAALAWLTLSAWAMVRYTRRLGRGWLALAAFALAWAVLTRWASALAAAAWALAALAAWRSARLPARRVAGHAVLAAAVGGLVLAVQFAPAAVGGPLSHTGDLTVVGWDPANALRRTVTNSDGVFHYPVPIGLFYALPAVHPAYVPALLTPFLFLGVAGLRRLARPAAMLLVAWPVATYAFLAGIAWESPRFALTLFPALAVLVGLGFERARLVWPAPGRRSFTVALAVAGLAWSLAWSGRDVARFVAGKNAAVAASRWVEGKVPRGAILLTFGVTATAAHTTSLEVVELYNATAAELDVRLVSGRPAFLVLDLASVNGQWAGRPPQLNFAWLRDHAGLVEAGRYGAFTLWRVCPHRQSPPAPARPAFAP
jgi:4-amino-4-deoxy-L-arabinose transferase-like glycosyltransferase